MDRTQPCEGCNPGSIPGEVKKISLKFSKNKVKANNRAINFLLILIVIANPNLKLTLDAQDDHQIYQILIYYISTL
jgi:hypothetical protein